MTPYEPREAVEAEKSKPENGRTYNFNVYTGETETAYIPKRDIRDIDIEELAYSQSLFDNCARAFAVTFKARLLTITYKPLKRAGVCKSKKRFIKLMMSLGAARNTARELAKEPCRTGGTLSYQKWYAALRGYKRVYGTKDYSELV